MGVVHLAHDREGHPVAIKVLRQFGDEGPNARRRLAREVETMRRVRSPYVAEVLDADVTGEFPYIVTRFVSGPTLEQMVRRRGPLPTPGLRRLAFGTAEALAAIHAAGVVHRDLKPGNVMLANDYPVVIDFGIAQTGDATRLTQTGLVMGTPGYLAPEVIEGAPSSPASDVHCWGATMAFAATGRMPFGGGSYEAIFYRIVSGAPDLEGVPAPLVPLISAALARDPAHRPPADWLSAQAKSLESSAHPASAASAASADLNQTATYIPTQKPQNPQKPQGLQSPQQTRQQPDLPKSRAPVPASSPWPQDQLQKYRDQREQYRQDQENVSRPAPAGQFGPAAPNAPTGQFGPTSTGQFGPADDQRRKSPPRPNTMAGLAVMIAAVALTVVLPVAGLIASLVVVTLLRAADRAQSTLAVRRSVRGSRPSDLLIVVVMAPLTVARALLTQVLIAPLALIAGAAAYAATIVLTHSLDTPRAGAFAAAAIVAWYGLGPGSRKPRRQLNRMAGVLARTTMSGLVTAVVVWALAAAAVLFASSQTPYYWPAVAPHLPALPHLVTSVTTWLLQHTHA